MSLNNPIKIIDTLAFRLTVWYAGIFALTFVVAIIFFYVFIKADLYKRTEQDLLNETKEFSSIFLLKGVEEFKAAVYFETESEGSENVFFRIISMDGTEIGSSNLSSWGFISEEPALKRLKSGLDHFSETITIPGTSHKARILYSVIGTDKVFQIGQSMKDDEELMETFRNIFATTIVFMVIFAGLVGWFMAKRALMGVEEVTQTAINISHGEFNSRVPIIGRGEEIDRLATTFNNMLEHIQGLIKGMKEITDNIAHDLRSPLTRIRGIAETTIITAGAVTDYELMTGNIIEECDRLIDMINTMLDISEAEAGVSRLEMTKIDISDLLRDACELFQPIAEDKLIHLTQKAEKGLSIYADNQKLQRVIANLLDNALKYTPSGGKIDIFAYQDGQELVITFSDTGIGIPEEDLLNVFKRFYRCDHSRSQPGIGLGLSLAQAIVKAHGGNISVRSLPDKGSFFTLILPMNN